MSSRQTLKLGYLDKTYHFLEGLKLCHVTGTVNRYETFVRTFFLKLCQKDNHLQSREH